MNNPDDKPPLIWLNILVFAITGLIALIGVPLYAWYEGFDTFTLVAAVLALGYCGISITAGYHRLWAHKTYEAHPILQWIFAIGGAFAIQNSALHWASDHRVHHKHVDDNDKDPYSAKKGFWYSHIGWMLRDYQTRPYNDYNNCRDLQRNKIVMWQHKYYLPLCIGVNFGIPLLLGLYNGNVWGMLLMVGVLRLVLNHHFTFFINSLAHIWGSRPYTDKNTARDNGFLALLTYGEGYHNFHHIFETDYRNGIKWWHFDPTKWLIKACSYVKLTSNLKVSPEHRIEKARADMLLKVSKNRLLNLPSYSDQLEKYQEQIEKLQAEYDNLMVKLNQYCDTKRQLMDLKKRDLKDKWQQLQSNELAERVRLLKSHWQAQKTYWEQFNRQLQLA